MFPEIKGNGGKPGKLARIGDLGRVANYDEFVRGREAIFCTRIVASVCVILIYARGIEFISRVFSLLQFDLPFLMK